MTKPFQGNIVDEIISELPLKEKVSLANMKKEDVGVLQSVFDLYIRNKIGLEDIEYEDLMSELWRKLKKTHRMRIVK
jgi:hypothetical protein